MFHHTCILIFYRITFTHKHCIFICEIPCNVELFSEEEEASATQGRIQEAVVTQIKHLHFSQNFPTDNSHTEYCKIVGYKLNCHTQII
jgi:hypothetical protein